MGIVLRAAKVGCGRHTGGARLYPHADRAPPFTTSATSRRLFLTSPPHTRHHAHARAAQAEIKRYDGQIPRSATANMLAAGDRTATLALLWALAVHYYIERLDELTDKR